MHRQGINVSSPARGSRAALLGQGSGSLARIEDGDVRANDTDRDRANDSELDMEDDSAVDTENPMVVELRAAMGEAAALRERIQGATGQVIETRKTLREAGDGAHFDRGALTSLKDELKANLLE